jgi:hypothetical protein
VSFAQPAYTQFATTDDAEAELDDIAVKDDVVFSDLGLEYVEYGDAIVGTVVVDVVFCDFRLKYVSDEDIVVGTVVVAVVFNKNEPVEDTVLRVAVAPTDELAGEETTDEFSLTDIV